MLQNILHVCVLTFLSTHKSDIPSVSLTNSNFPALFFSHSCPLSLYFLTVAFHRESLQQRSTLLLFILILYRLACQFNEYFNIHRILWKPEGNAASCRHRIFTVRARAEHQTQFFLYSRLLSQTHPSPLSLNAHLNTYQTDGNSRTSNVRGQARIPSRAGSRPALLKGNRELWGARPARLFSYAKQALCKVV